MIRSLLLGTLFAFAACSRSEKFEETTHGISVAACRLTESGGEIYHSQDGSPWRLVARGCNPCLSPNGQLLAYTDDHTERSLSQSVRYIRVLDLTTGALTPLTKFEQSKNQYAARWSVDGRQVLFNICVNHDWWTGKFAYPTLDYSRVPNNSQRPPVHRESISTDGHYELDLAHVPGDPPLAHDLSTGLFVIDHQTGKRTRVTPKDFWVSGGATWIEASHEVLLNGMWHSDYNDKAGEEYIYRLDPFARDWSVATKKDWAAKRLFRGGEVSCVVSDQKEDTSLGKSKELNH